MNIIFSHESYSSGNASDSAHLHVAASALDKPPPQITGSNNTEKPFQKQRAISNNRFYTSILALIPAALLVVLSTVLSAYFNLGILSSISVSLVPAISGYYLMKFITSPQTKEQNIEEFREVLEIINDSFGKEAPYDIKLKALTNYHNNKLKEPKFPNIKILRSSIKTND